jgi:transposase-like protein
MCSLVRTDMDKHSLQLLLAQGVSVERIAKRFGKDPSTISYWLKRHGLISPYAAKHAARGAPDPQQLEGCVQSGMTIAEIAAEVGRSKATVRHWLKRFGLRTKNGRGTRHPGVTKAAKNAGLLRMTRVCPTHGETEFVLEGCGYYRCKRCRMDRVLRHRRTVKARLVDEAGGRCSLCGYDHALSALHFHHLDPSTKRLELSRSISLSIEALREEARKCILLCSNCHAEVESGMVELPLEFP